MHDSRNYDDDRLRVRGAASMLFTKVLEINDITKTCLVCNSVAESIALVLIEGFDKHYRLFRAKSAEAKELFENGQWHDIQRAIRERIEFYDARVAETVERLQTEFHAGSLDDATWQEAKLLYIGLLVDHKQPELAETFFNSVCCRILHRTYFHNGFIFFRPAISTEYIESDPPTYRSYYPKDNGLRRTFSKIIRSFGWCCPFANLGRDIAALMKAVRRHLGGTWPRIEVNCQLQVLCAPFYRNKAAYIIGKAVNGHFEYPFAVPVLRDDDGTLYIDTVLLDSWRIGLLFSLSRAYFLVDMEVPSGYTRFLQDILPKKPLAELYTMLGLAKQGKTMFYRDLAHHLRHSQDSFIVAPGVRGMVMLVFTLPSFPYVFKVIKDHVAPPKEVDRATVKAKYQLVKEHSRVGRMADTLEFSDVALPKNRIAPDLFEDIRRLCASVVEEEEENIVIKHLYIERRMEPLNIYLDRATPSQIDQAILEYGNAIRELASSNIFPGDMLFKNFGMTRYGRVVFYDYDDIEYMSSCNFRSIPKPPPEYETSGEIWYSVAENDVFPAQFADFLLGPPAIREAFMKYHADLLDPRFWREQQKQIALGHVQDFFPYPEAQRFRNLYAVQKA